jgi:hypothetical protein
MINPGFKIISSAALCCILAAALPSEANAIKILSRPNQNTAQPTSSQSNSQGYSQRPSQSNSAPDYSNNNNNSSTDNAKFDTPYSKTKHLTIREVTNYANAIGSGLACLADDEDKKTIRGYQKVVRAIMINKAKTRQELDDAIQHFTKTVRKAHHAQSSKGLSGCGETMKKIKNSAMMKVGVFQDGDIAMPDGTFLKFDPSKVKNMIKKEIKN